MTEPAVRGSRRWLWAVVFAWLVLGFAVQMTAFWRHAAKPQDLDMLLKSKAVALGYLGSGLTTLAVWLAFRLRPPFPHWSDKKRFLWLGWLGAAWVETLFWAAEMLTGAHHVAASHNLLLDLVFTMPWYVSMVWIFQRAQCRCGFSWPVAALLGGLYETGCDGGLGAALGGTLFSPAYWVLMVFAYPAFVVVYSPMVLPSVWFASPQPAAPLVGRSRVKWALAPLWALIPFAVYYVAIIVAVGALSGKP